MTNLLAIQDSTAKLNKLCSVIIVPLLGILIPNLSGLISNERYDGWQLLLSYAYFVFTALMIWRGNLMFLKNIRKKYEDRSIGYFKMLSSYFLVNLFYSAVISLTFLFAWQLMS